MEPVVAQTEPFPVEVDARETHYWCRCGWRSKQPFRDRTHMSLQRVARRGMGALPTTEGGT